MEGESPGPAPATKGPAAQLLRSQAQLAHQRPPRSLCHSCSYHGYPAESAPPGGSRPSTPGVPPLRSGVTLGCRHLMGLGHRLHLGVTAAPRRLPAPPARHPAPSTGSMLEGIGPHWNGDQVCSAVNPATDSGVQAADPCPPGSPCAPEHLKTLYGAGDFRLRVSGGESGCPTDTGAGNSGDVQG